MEFVFAVALAVLAGWFVSAPFRAGAAVAQSDAAGERRSELEAAKEAKYREIRDAELDHAAGKTTPREFEELDAELRAEAIAILREMDRLGEARSSG